MTAMADVGTVVVVLGLLPFLALLLYGARRALEAHRDVAWGVLAGLLAFLAIGHGMAALLVGHPLLSGTAGEGVALIVLAGGLGFGLWASWEIIIRPVPRPGPFVAGLAWASAAYLGLHSLSDGLLLGEALVAADPEISIDAVTIGATVVHRIAEGALVVIPALAAAWRVGRSLSLLSLGLFVVPGAALMAAILQLPLSGMTVSAIAFGVRSFLPAIEAGFGLVLLMGGFLPQALASNRTRWIAAAALAFLAIAFVHGLVE